MKAKEVSGLSSRGCARANTCSSDLCRQWFLQVRFTDILFSFFSYVWIKLVAKSKLTIFWIKPAERVASPHLRNVQDQCDIRLEGLFRFIVGKLFSCLFIMFSFVSLYPCHLGVRAIRALLKFVPRPQLTLPLLHLLRGKTQMNRGWFIVTPSELTGIPFS